MSDEDDPWYYIAVWSDGVVDAPAGGIPTSSIDHYNNKGDELLLFTDHLVVVGDPDSLLQVFVHRDLMVNFKTITLWRP
jgi:hypothetical protein